MWEYPSPQMFFNAMRRKGHNPREEEMEMVVAIHNAVNERAWQEVLKWEQMHKSQVRVLRPTLKLLVVNMWALNWVVCIMCSVGSPHYYVSRVALRIFLPVPVFLVG